MNVEALEATTLMLTVMAGSFALNNVTLSIPIFDVKNIPLRDFIQDVRNGAAQITENQTPNFIKAVLAKLKGPARDSIFNKTFETFPVVHLSFPINEDGLLGRQYMRENKAVIFYHYNAMAINSNVLNPIPFINNDHENISSDKNTRGYTHIRAKRESRQRNNPKDIPLIPQLEKYQAPSQINSFKDIQADRNFVLECDQMTVISPHELNSDPKPSIFKIPGRCRQVVKINLIHTTLREGYLPRIPTNPNIIIGECVVTNQNDSFQVLALNTSYEDVEVKIPSQKIVEYNCLSDIFGSSSEEEANPTLRLEDRIEKMLQILDTKHLNEEEQQHVRSLVTEYPDRFILPGDPLPCTNLVEHEIPTTDNIPINTKQYGPPPIHKKVAQEDVEKKLRDGIIEPSNSPMNSPMRIVPKKTAPGRKFTLQSDHEPLNWMHSRKDPGQRLMRWMFKFSDYDFDFKYKPGKENVVADGLSIIPPERDLSQNLPSLKVMMLKSNPKSTPPSKLTGQKTHRRRGKAQI
ncbi:hypothetical protein TKK_0017096 [Trichogramma kaykai]